MATVFKQVAPTATAIGGYILLNVVLPQLQVQYPELFANSLGLTVSLVVVLLCFIPLLVQVGDYLCKWMVNLRRKKQITGMVFVIVLGILFFFGAIGGGYYLFKTRVPPDAIVYYGENDIPGQPLATLRVDAKGDLLLPFADRYKLAAIAFKWSGVNDYIDSGNVLKSGLHDIRADKMSLVIPVNQEFIKALVEGHLSTNYSLLLVPNRVNMDQWSTLREARKLGVLIVATHGGPP